MATADKIDEQLADQVARALGLAFDERLRNSDPAMLATDPRTAIIFAIVMFTVDLADALQMLQNVDISLALIQWAMYSGIDIVAQAPERDKRQEAQADQKLASAIMKVQDLI